MSLPLCQSILHSARELWNFHKLEENLQTAEGVLVFGSNDLRVADYAAELYHKRMASWILFTGGRGRMTEHWPDTEAACFAIRARELGVPESAVHCEPKASHTGENITFSRELIARRNLPAERVIVLQKPYMERRTRASIERQWPELLFQVSSPPMNFEQYPNESISMDDLIHAMVGDLFRIIDYPSKGLSSEQHVPPAVKDAYQHLISSGFTKQLPG
ncbi:MAG: hypothetical protein RLZZ553_1430 [Verrucomicrobiota bacterium]|jgi:uncharacterized SAM-binding protein YcdF (DUF218 family)